MGASFNASITLAGWLELTGVLRGRFKIALRLSCTRVAPLNPVNPQNVFRFAVHASPSQITHSLKPCTAPSTHQSGQLPLGYVLIQYDVACIPACAAGQRAGLETRQCSLQVRDA